ncbi:MAG TPA: hypothetical protein VGF55_01315 [Gemmataceae bacterium]
MSRSTLLAAGCAAVFLVPLTVTAQPPGGYGGDRGDRGRGGFSRDPDERFNQLSGGKDVIVIDQLDERTKMFMGMMAQRMGVTNGRITRDQYKSAMESFRSRMMGGGGPGGFGGGPPGVTSITIQGGPPGGDRGFGRGGGPMSPEQIDRMSEDYMRRHDKNGDGLLQVTEMSDRLRPVWEKFDANKDGAISLDEVKAYLRDRDQTRQQEQASAAPPQTHPGEPAHAAPADGLPPAPDAVPAQEEDKRPVMYRIGKLPKELPGWFADLDSDKDGPVALYEWVKGGRSIDEFKLMDRNDDNLLTIEEVLGYVKNGDKQPGSVAVASSGAADERPGGDFRSRFGGGLPGMRPDGGSGDMRGPGGDFRGRFGFGPPGSQSGNGDMRGRGPRTEGGDYPRGGGRGPGRGRGGYDRGSYDRGSSDRSNAPDGGDREPKDKKDRKKDKP